MTAVSLCLLESNPILYTKHNSDKQDESFFFLFSVLRFFIDTSDGTKCSMSCIHVLKSDKQIIAF